MCSSEKQSWENASVLTGIIQALRIKKKLTEFQVFKFSSFKFFLVADIKIRQKFRSRQGTGLNGFKITVIGVTQSNVVLFPAIGNGLVSASYM